jgi:hypothetical protein
MFRVCLVLSVMGFRWEPHAEPTRLAFLGLTSYFGSSALGSIDLWSNYIYNVYLSISTLFVPFAFSSKSSILQTVNGVISNNLVPFSPFMCYIFPLDEEQV